MFDTDLENQFQIFSASHFVTILIVFFFVFLVYQYREKLKEKKYYNFFRYLFVVITIGQELSLNIYRMINGEWVIATSLPLQLCGLAMIITSLILITQSETLFQRTFFVMMIGAFMAIATPAIENDFGFPHYRFIQFFVGHGMILINFTFMLFVMDYHANIQYKHVLYNIVTLLGLAAFNYIVNILTGGNYMYLMGKPGENTAFDLFGEHPWYILNIIVFGIPIFFHIFYTPFLIRNVRKNRLMAKS
jgi:hypothetical integral membrane protein (TIGR02206 family)